MLIFNFTKRSKLMCRLKEACFRVPETIFGGPILGAESGPIFGPLTHILIASGPFLGSKNWAHCSVQLT